MKNQPVTPASGKAVDRPTEAPIKDTVSIPMIDLRKPGAFIPLLLSGGHDD